MKFLIPEHVDFTMHLQLPQAKHVCAMYMCVRTYCARIHHFREMLVHRRFTNVGI
jgi:hypothetical protein